MGVLKIWNGATWEPVSSGPTLVGDFAFAVFARTVPVAVGAGEIGFPVGEKLDGRSITQVTAVVATPGTGGIMGMSVKRLRGGTEVAVIDTTIDPGEYDSSTAAAADVTYPSNQLLERGDWVLLDITSVHSTPALGLSVYVATAVL